MVKVMKDFLIREVKKHLVSCGFSENNSQFQAEKVWHFFQNQICNSRDPFKECCDYAGVQAALMETGVKYVSPKAKARKRGSKRPQEAFKF